MSLDEYEKEIERILEYPRKVSEKVVEENKKEIITCLKHYNAFDDWGQVLPFIAEISDGCRLRTWETFLEANINMEVALIQAIHGMYKSSLMSLRSCLETSLLMVFYSYPEKDAEYDDWWNGTVDTPRFRDIINFLFAKTEFQKFDARYSLLQKLKDEHKELSSYIHSRGYNRFESHFRTPREKRTEIFGDYLGFDPNFVKKLGSQISKLLEMTSLVFALRFHGVSSFLKKTELIDKRLCNIILTLPKQTMEQILDYYGIDPSRFWNEFYVQI
ncbi:MAG: hypothetical protein OEW71_03425 [Candidatus Bathyarchaeota archaeon]|nr:hypothetical protein [Candidatus Bathyarchaeota archaeon]